MGADRKVSSESTLDRQIAPGPTNPLTFLLKTGSGPCPCSKPFYWLGLMPEKPDEEAARQIESFTENFNKRAAERW